MKLRRREFCPIHKSLFCCGRTQNALKRQPFVAVQRIEDPHHPQLATTFYGQTRPISEKWSPEALAISAISREEHLRYEAPELVMSRFAGWVKEHSSGRPVFVSDNLAFDWQFINYYFHAFAGGNPFGFSGPSHWRPVLRVGKKHVGRI